jgi:hypothetical protein
VKEKENENKNADCECSHFDDDLSVNLCLVWFSMVASYERELVHHQQPGPSSAYSDLCFLREGAKQAGLLG